MTKGEGVFTEIPSIAELLDFLGVESGAVGYGEGVVIGHILLVDPISHLVLMVVLDVTIDAVLLRMNQLGTPPLVTTLVEVRLSNRGSGKLLQNQEACQTKCPLETAFKNSRVYAATIEFGPVYLGS